MKPLLTIVILLSIAHHLVAAEAVDFVRDVRPIFEQHCYDCHGAEKQKSGLRLDVKTAALMGGEYHEPNILPKQPEQSKLIRFVSGEDEEIVMPPKGDRLSAAEIETLKAWISQGAPWPDGVDLVKLDDPADHWAFQPVQEVGPPAVKQQDWLRSELDAFILARLEVEGLEPAPETDRQTWLRRVTLDLTGLPPTPQELDAFLKDQGEVAYEQVVDRLLASPRYGERWGQHWLDVVRYADTHGFEVNTPRPNAWPYRDYVIEAFNRDTPYDRFIREQLAGDALGQDAATGFLVTAAALLPGQIGKDAESMRLARQDELGETVINVGEAFLGLSIGCARCHDHKFDPITAEDYYSVQAFFTGLKYGERPVIDESLAGAGRELRAQLGPVAKELAGFEPVARSGKSRPPINSRINVERFSPVTTKKVRLTILETNKLEPCIDELEVYDVEGRNLALASGPVKVKASGSKRSARRDLLHINDGQYGNSSSWMSSEKGAGWVELSFPKPETIDRVTWGRDRDGKFGDRLALKYRVEVADAEGKWQLVASEEDRKAHDPDKVKDLLVDLTSFSEAERKRYESLTDQAEKLREKLQGFPAGGQPVFAGQFMEPEPTHLLRRGDPEQPQDLMSPAVPVSLGDLKLPLEAGDLERRMRVAKWISSTENPLTARVMANRIWQWHFGMGLVETANDFGNIGTPPTHPELLDWLATEFVESGWSIKSMQREIVLSATYRQSSRITDEGNALDADVRLLWRFPSRRMEAEAIRDTILAVNGRLNLKTGGPGFDLFNSRGGLSGFKPVESFSGDGLRRMIYAHRVRMEPDAVFGAFDCPDAGQSAPRRGQSTTPVQALNLFNSQFTIDEAAAFAQRVIAEAGTGVAQQVRLAWKLAYGREPDPGELQDASAVVEEHGLETLCRVIYNTNEFVLLP